MHSFPSCLFDLSYNDCSLRPPTPHPASPPAAKIAFQMRRHPILSRLCFPLFSADSSYISMLPSSAFLPAFLLAWLGYCSASSLCSMGHYFGIKFVNKSKSRRCLTLLTGFSILLPCSQCKACCWAMDGLLAISASVQPKLVGSHRLNYVWCSLGHLHAFKRQAYWAPVKLSASHSRKMAGASLIRSNQEKASCRVHEFDI